MYEINCESLKDWGMKWTNKCSEVYLRRFKDQENGERQNEIKQEYNKR